MGAVFPRKSDRRFADSQDAGVGDGCAPPNPAPLAAAGVRWERVKTLSLEQIDADQTGFSYRFDNSGAFKFPPVPVPSFPILL